MQSSSIGDKFPIWMSELDGVLFGKSKEKARKTRSGKRQERQRRGQLQVDLEADGSDGGDDETGWSELGGEGIVLVVSAQELKEWQASDEALRMVREAVQNVRLRKVLGFSLGIACYIGSGYHLVEGKRWQWSNWCFPGNVKRWC